MICALIVAAQLQTTCYVLAIFTLREVCGNQKTKIMRFFVLFILFSITIKVHAQSIFEEESVEISQTVYTEMTMMYVNVFNSYITVSYLNNSSSLQKKIDYSQNIKYSDYKFIVGFKSELLKLNKRYIPKNVVIDGIGQEIKIYKCGKVEKSIFLGNQSVPIVDSLFKTINNLISVNKYHLFTKGEY